jgi:hypothetical protein
MKSAVSACNGAGVCRARSDQNQAGPWPAASPLSSAFPIRPRDVLRTLVPGRVSNRPLSWSPIVAILAFKIADELRKNLIRDMSATVRDLRAARHHLFVAPRVNILGHVDIGMTHVVPHNLRPCAARMAWNEWCGNSEILSTAAIGRVRPAAKSGCQYWRANWISGV